VSNCPEVHEHVLLAKKALKEAEATTFAAMTQGHATLALAHLAMADWVREHG
jgi:hypothetical protein